ncbi:LysR family transcriptional regulator [Pacificimonas sp. WHA3]|uniref:LysR family transcriptional regulator n=1 Tax=Pacificimonas pallii TaxID=2827236 RepID=A0ABS6SAP6_9SPHN|nr:LysR family transcriptional regulator [Pacificimonas pallii]
MVARLGGIRKAAKWLDRDHAVVSRHLRMIETWSGVKLVERTPVGVALTDKGRWYHEAVSLALDNIAHATLDLLNHGQHNRLVIWSSPGFALHWLSRHLTQFEKKIPGLDIEVRPVDSEPDFASHQADLHIRFISNYQNELDDNPLLRHETIAEAEIIAVTGETYLAKHPAIETPADLINHQLLHESGFENWIAWLKAHGVAADGKVDGPRLWQGHLTMDAAEHGNGIALSNTLVAREELNEGALINIGKDNPAFEPKIGQYVLVARRDRWNDSLVRRFRSWLKRRVSRDLA